MFNPWMNWLVLAGVLVILELFSGSFYLLMIALGMLAGAVLASFGATFEWQLILAALVGALATITLHKSKYGWREAESATRDPNVNMDIGQTILVQEWVGVGNGNFTSRAMYRGAMWDVELHNSSPYAGNFRIDEIRGSCLLVRPA